MFLCLCLFHGMKRNATVDGLRHLTGPGSGMDWHSHILGAGIT